MVRSIRHLIIARRSSHGDPDRLTRIRAGTEVHGSLTAVAGSAVLVEGTLNGDILGGGVVYVAPSGRVRGSIEGQEVIVAGEIDGDVHASGRCEVHASGQVIGAVRTGACLFLEGARVAGTVRIGAVDERVLAAVAARDAAARDASARDAGVRPTSTNSPRAFRMVLEP